MKVILGKKIGMSQAFNSETGELTPVTVIDVSGNVVARLIKNGEVTQAELGVDKKKNPRKSDLGQYKELKYVPKYSWVTDIEEGEEFVAGNEVKADLFQEGDIVDLSGVSKGKGFSGVIKRWNFKGGKRTHGQSDRERAPGSIGAGTTPGRVLKGKKMPGRMGRDKTTVKRLKIMQVDVENNLITVKGAVPGYKGAYVAIRESFFNKLKK